MSSMGGAIVLAVDVGNSTTHIGWFRGRTPASVRSCRTRERSQGEWEEELDRALRRAPALDGSALASVVPAVNPGLEAALGARCGRPPLVVGPRLKMPVQIAVEAPEELGADRIANAVAAVERFRAPVIVVDLGTATTFEVVDAEGRLLGGAIAPGALTGLAALTERAARLPQVEIGPPGRAIGRSTRESMVSGVVLGHAAMIDGMVARIREELGGPCPVIATGGLAALVALASHAIDEVDPHLTLRGIVRLYELNAG